jgi:hypothetical protein
LKKRLLSNFPIVPAGRAKEGETFPGNELPGYFQKSLRD